MSTFHIEYIISQILFCLNGVGVITMNFSPRSYCRGIQSNQFMSLFNDIAPHLLRQGIFLQITVKKIRLIHLV